MIMTKPIEIIDADQLEREKVRQLTRIADGLELIASANKRFSTTDVAKALGKLLADDHMKVSV